MVVVDELAGTRGFEKFVGKTIVDVDSTCINVVRFTTDTGEVITIDCDDQVYGIGVIQVREEE